METTASIVVIGDEILSGKYADENGRLAIDELRSVGVRLTRIAIIGDDEEEIGRTVVDHSGRADVVITSGGVGPTHDDRTMAGIARGFGTRIVHHPRFVALLARHYGEPLGPGHLRLAEIPEGAELVDAPGLEVPIVRFRNVHVLPGVPSLFRRKLLALAEALRGAPYVTARVTLAVDETAIAGPLAAVAAAHPGVAIGSYPRFDAPAFELILTLEGKDRGAVEAALAALLAGLGPLVLRVDPVA